MGRCVGPIDLYTLATAITIGSGNSNRRWQDREELGYSIVYIESALAGPNAQGQKNFHSLRLQLAKGK